MSDTTELIPNELLPKGFKYPAELMWLINHGVPVWHPWIIETGRALTIRYEGLKKRYPSRELIPFAGRLDCDDVACWDLAHPGKVALIHDFSRASFEQVKWYENLWEWFKSSVEDTIEFAKRDIDH